MNPVLETESTLTDRYQTTVPETVRARLGLGKRDKLHYKIMSDGTVVLSRVVPEQVDDPVLSGFVALLAGELQQQPGAIRPLGAQQRKR